MSDRNQEQDIIDGFSAWGTTHDLVRAMILTSSRTTKKAPVDVLSDYDLILILRDIRPFFVDRKWLGDFGPVLAAYADPIILEDRLETSGYITQYENGLKIDFSLWPVELLQQIVGKPQLPDEFDAGYRVLLDKDHLTDGLKSPTYSAYIPSPPTELEYLTKIETFFVEAAYIAKFLWRDDIIAAKDVLDHFMKQEDLLPMLEWHLEIDHHWSVKPGPHGRRLKQWLRADLWAELEMTYTGTDLDANWEGLFRTISLFRKVAIEVGEHLGYVYPDDLHRRAVHYVQTVKSMDRHAKGFPAQDNTSY